jgi:hypothetical protein
LTGFKVNCDSDGEVEDCNESLAEEDSLLVVSLVSHLGGDREAKS